MAESRAERRARRALIEAAEGSEEKKSSKKSKSSQDAKGKSAKGKAKAKRPGSRRSEDKASQTRSKRSHIDQVSSARKAVDPKSPCPIMKACGGCTALNRPYKKQLAAKQAVMEELFAALCEREGISVDPIRGMGVTLGDPGKYPAPRGFRHKAATPFAPGREGAVRCGFFERGTHKIVAVPECPVEAPGARQILNGIAREAERLHIPAFNEDKHLGLLRYAVVRCGWRTDQVMVTLVTAQRDLPHAQEFFEAVAALNPHIVTVAQNINGRPGNAILGEKPALYMAPSACATSCSVANSISPLPRFIRPTRNRPSCSISSLSTAWICTRAMCSWMPTVAAVPSACAQPKPPRTRASALCCLAWSATTPASLTHVATPSSTALLATHGLWPTMPPITS